MAGRIKIMGLVLSLLLFFTVPDLAVPAGAAEISGIGVSRTSVSANEIFTVSLNIPAAQRNADTVSLRAEFDEDAFEVVSWVTGLPGCLDNHGAGFFTTAGSNSGAQIDLSGGLVLTAVMRVKESAERGVYTFSLTKSSFSWVDDNGSTYHELWVPTVRSVNVTVGSNVPPYAGYPVTGGGISVSYTYVQPGDQFYVYVNVPEIPHSADTAGIRVEFSPDAFETVSWSPAVTGAQAGRGTGYFSLAAGNSSAAIDLSGGLALRAEVKVRDNAPDRSCNFTLKTYSLAYAAGNGYTYQELWMPEVFSASVTVEDLSAFSPVRGGGISVSGTSYKPGDTFRVSVTVPEIPHTADTAGIRAEFDSSAFEVTSWAPRIAGGTSNSGSGYFSLAAANQTEAIDPGSGFTFTAEVKVKDNAPADDYTFRLVKHTLTFNRQDGYTPQEMWIPAVTSASVKVVKSTDPDPVPDPDPDPDPVPATVRGGGIRVSGTYQKPGDTFYVYIDVPASEYKADAALIRAEFDPGAFTAVSWRPAVPGASYNTGNGYFGLSAENSRADIDLSGGLTLRAEVKVKDSAAEKLYTFRLTGYSLSVKAQDRDKPYELWTPTTTSAAVIVGKTEVNDPAVTGGGISLSRSGAYQGSTFTLYVNVPVISEKADSGNIRVNYDGSIFELVAWEPVITGGADYSGYGYIGLTAGTAGRSIDLGRGLTFMAVFRAKSTAPVGTYSFSLAEGSFSYLKNNGYERQELWIPAVRNAGINVVSGYVPYRSVVTDNTGTVNTAGTVDRNPVRGTEVIDGGDDPDITISPEQENTGDDDPAADDGDDLSDPDDTEEETVPDDDDGTAADPDDDSDENNSENNSENNNDDSTENGGENTAPKADIQISLESELEGITGGRVLITTKKRFFDGDMIVIISNTGEAEKAGLAALGELGLDGHAYYAFDISVYDTAKGEYLHSLPEGYIDFDIPVPDVFDGSADFINVYHTADSQPEFIGSETDNTTGSARIHFRADSFSPYLFVDMANPNTQPVIVPGTEVQPEDSNGNVNPHTGVAAAVVIPSAVAGCVLLARKTRKRRKRAKSEI